MSFTQRRGRPRNNTPSTDQGTPELQQKRQLTLTDEPLDICLARQIISDAEHKAGRRLHWLHRLCFGKTWVTALNTDKLNSRSPSEADTSWQEIREKELHQALDLLETKGNRVTVLDICVYSRRPQFLMSPASSISTLRQQEMEQAGLQQGLSALAHHWQFGQTPL